MNHSTLERIRVMKIKFLKSSVLTGVLGMLGICCVSIPAQAVNVNGVINATITLEGACSINGSAPVAGATWGTLDFGSQSTLFTTATAQGQRFRLITDFTPVRHHDPSYTDDPERNQ